LALYKKLYTALYAEDFLIGIGKPSKNHSGKNGKYNLHSFRDLGGHRSNIILPQIKVHISNTACSNNFCLGGKYYPCDKISAYE